MTIDPPRPAISEITFETPPRVRALGPLPRAWLSVAFRPTRANIAHWAADLPQRGAWTVISLATTVALFVAPFALFLFRLPTNTFRPPTLRFFLIMQLIPLVFDILALIGGVLIFALLAWSLARRQPRPSYGGVVRALSLIQVSKLIVLVVLNGVITTALASTVGLPDLYRSIFQLASGIPFVPFTIASSVLTNTVFGLPGMIYSVAVTVQAGAALTGANRWLLALLSVTLMYATSVAFTLVNVVLYVFLLRAAFGV